MQMNNRYVQPVESGYYTPGDVIHSALRGYGTVTPDGKGIEWHTWKPPTQEDIDKHKARIEWLKSPEGQEYCRETDRIIDDLLVRHGTSREKMGKTLLDVIQKAPPFSETFKR
jgi:hypothetical protein